MFVFDRLFRALPTQINRESISFNAGCENYEALKSVQDKYNKDNDIYKDSISFLEGSTVAVQ